MGMPSIFIESLDWVKDPYSLAAIFGKEMILQEQKELILQRKKHGLRPRECH